MHPFRVTPSPVEGEQAAGGHGPDGFRFPAAPHFEGSCVLSPGLECWPRVPIAEVAASACVRLGVYKGHLRLERA